MLLVANIQVRMQKLQNDGTHYWYHGILTPKGDRFVRSVMFFPDGEPSKLFTYVTDRETLPKEAILSGEDVQFGKGGRTGTSFAVDVLYEKDDAIWGMLDLSYDEATQAIRKGSLDLLAKLNAYQEKLKTLLLDTLGKRNNFTTAILERYKERTLEVLENNPWELILHIPYFTVVQADKIAKAVGLDLKNPKRLQALFRKKFTDTIEQQKATYLTEQQFMAFYWMHFASEYTLEEYRNAVKNAESPIAIQSPLGYHPTHLYMAEKRSVAQVKRLLSKKEESKPYQLSLDFTLTREQEEAVEVGYTDGLHLLTGGPGTGKTTCLTALLQKLEQQTGIRRNDPDFPVLLVAPTGKAATRMTQQTGCPARTIHSAFGMVPDMGILRLDTTLKNLSHIDYLLLDEASMLDTLVFGEICRVLERRPHIQVMLVGDADQLPPVGIGQVFFDLLAHLREHVPSHVTTLTEVKRQGEDSGIVELASYLRKGQFPQPEWFAKRDDVFFVETTLPELEMRLCQQVLKPKEEQLGDIQILTPYRNGDSADTIHAINRMARPIYNRKVGKETRPFLPGDKVVCKKNLSETVVNGSIGTVIESPLGDLFDDGVTYVSFDGKIQSFLPDQRPLELAYALTIHASQGSEYPQVVLPLFRPGSSFCNRNLLYTGITRARDTLLLLGRWDYFAAAAKNPQTYRHTALAAWL